MHASQGHSVSHVRDDLILTALSVDDTPEYAAHGTYYDFYESILRLRIVAGGQQGQSFRRHVHMVEELPWEGAISGVRSDCDLAIWINTSEAAAAGVKFYRSANAVLLTDATIDPAFFHSIQILRSAEVLTADGGPPNPQQVALAIYRASASDTRSSEQYMALCLPSACQATPREHAISLPVCLHRRTRCANSMDTGHATKRTLELRGKVRDRGRRVKVSVPFSPRRSRRRSACRLLSGPLWATRASFRHTCRTTPDIPARSHRVQSHATGRSQHTHVNSRMARVSNKLRRLKSSSSKRGYRSTRRRQQQVQRQSRRSHANIAAIRFYTACTCPIDNTVLCLENLLIACVKASFYLAVKRSVPDMQTISRYIPHKQAPTSRRCKPRPSSPKQYSRPGPKSGVRFWLRRLLMLTLIARPHGVRVPTQAAWVGESNIFANQSPNQELKHCGVQLSNAQNQLSTLSRSVKRSYKRACRRAHKYGQITYKGRILKANQCQYVELREGRQYSHTNPNMRQPTNGLHVFCYNAGGLGGGM